MTWNLVTADTFARADGAPGNGWIDAHGSTWSIVGNQLKGVADNIDGNEWSRDFLLRPAGENQLDQRILTTIGTGNPSGAHLWHVHRYNPNGGTPTAYILEFEISAGTAAINFYKISGSSATLLHGFSATVGSLSSTVTVDTMVTGANPTTLEMIVKENGTQIADAYYGPIGGGTGDSTPALQVSGQSGYTCSDASGGGSVFIAEFQSYNDITQSISVSPTSVLTSSTGNSLIITGIGTSFTGSPFTVSGGTITAQSVLSTTSATLTYNAPGTARTVTITDTGSGKTCTLSVATAATDFSLSPNPLNASPGLASGNVTVTLNGTLTSSESVALSDGGAGGTFTPGSLSFTTSDTAKTFTYRPASGAGGTSPTLTATGSGAFSVSHGVTCNVGAGPVIVLATDANMHFSPYAWDPNIVSGHRRCLGPGGYLKTAFSGTSAVLNLSAPSGTPQVRWSIDGAAYSVAGITNGTLVLATGLSGGSHTLDLEYMAANGGVGWLSSPAPNQYVEIVSIALDTGASSQARSDIRSKNIIFYGTSITQGVAATGATNGENGIGYDDALNTYCRGVAEALGAEYGQLGYTGQGYSFASAGGAGPPRFYTIGDPANSSWWQYEGGSSRLVAGRFSPVPDIVLIEQCRNDYAVTDATLEALIEAALTDIRAAAPGSWLLHLVPFDGTKRSAIQTAVAAYQAASSDTKCAVIDVAMDSYFNDSLKIGGGTASVGAIDGTHPDYRTHGIAAGKVAAAVQRAIGGASGQMSGYPRSRIANA